MRGGKLHPHLSGRRWACVGMTARDTVVSERVKRRKTDASVASVVHRVADISACLSCLERAEISALPLYSDAVYSSFGIALLALVLTNLYYSLCPTSPPHARTTPRRRPVRPSSPCTRILSCLSSCSPSQSQRRPIHDTPRGRRHSSRSDPSSMRHHARRGAARPVHASSLWLC